jgi:hypothetical protein
VAGRAITQTAHAGTPCAFGGHHDLQDLQHAHPAGDKVIECRRYPPTIREVKFDPQGNRIVSSDWPLLRESMVCGEYQKGRK